VSLVKKLTQILMKSLGFYLQSDNIESGKQCTSSESPEAQNMLVVIQNIDNSYKEIKKSTVIESDKSEFEVSSNSDPKKISVKEIEKNLHFCSEMNEAILDTVTELCIKIAKTSPEMQAFLREQKEIRRIMSQIDTVSNISGKKGFVNNMFFEYFKK